MAATVAAIVRLTRIEMTVRPMATEIVALKLRVARRNRTDAARVLVCQIIDLTLVRLVMLKTRWRRLCRMVQVEVLLARVKVAMKANARVHLRSAGQSHQPFAKRRLRMINQVMTLRVLGVVRRDRVRISLIFSLARFQFPRRWRLWPKLSRRWIKFALG